ncbi:MAG: TPM domain-containing protein [Bifidobacteriaceae bacterium]|nr:TPM domain-containing protein [Bifidobacteriaceae bacterium]
MPARPSPSRRRVSAGLAAVGLTVAVILAGCSASSDADFDEAVVIDESGPGGSGVLSASDEAAVTACANDFGARSGADRVVVVMLDEPQTDAETEALARSVIRQDPRDNQLVLVENVRTRYVWVEVGGTIRHHVGASTVEALTVPNVDAYRAGPRQGICATMREAMSHVSGWKRIALGGWVAGIVCPVLAAVVLWVALLRSYRLKTAAHSYDLTLARYQRLDGEDTFVREYHTRVHHPTGGGGFGAGRGGAGRTSGGGTHF